MMRTERRQTPRMTVEGLAYVNLEPDNGGVVLNISEGGLCFHSTTPIHRTAKIRFWFSQRRPRIEADGRMAWTDETQNRGVSRFIETDSELAWIDETKKIGGLRFTNLPEGASEDIRDWISQYATPAVVGRTSAPSFSSSRKSPSLSANLSSGEANVEQRSSTTLQVLLKSIQAPRLLTGYRGGLVSGLAISAFLVTSFLLTTHSREFGDSLIRLGQRLGGTSAQPASSEPLPASQEPQMASLEPQTPAPEPQPELPEPLVVPPAQITVLRPDKPLSQPKVAAINPHPASAFGTASTSAATPPPSVPAIAVDPTPDPNLVILRAAIPTMESANQPSVEIERSRKENTGSLSQKYLEVGKFNDKLLADEESEKLSQFGFPAMVARKKKKSYQVLVGPYGTDYEAEVAHKNLASRGFSPRSFERGTRGFTLPRALKVGGTRIPVGDCVISWESYTPDAIVRIEGYGGVIVSVEGKWIKRSVKYDQDAVVYTKNVDGSRTLNEIRFYGMGQALVFGMGNI